MCVKHGPDVWSAEAVEGLVAGESSEWTRGLEIDKRLMDAIRRASSVGSPTTEADRYALPMVDFAGATFKTPADFARTRFAGLAQFGGATFEQGAEFASAEFAEGCSFNQARFQGRAFFKAVTVAMGGWAGFTGIECDAVAAFNGITATNVDFSDSTFHALALFKGTFEANARLDRCRFEGTTEMGITVVCGSASIRDTEFGGFGEMARVCTRGEIDLEGSRFNEAFTLELNAEYIRLGRIHTIAGAQIKFSGDLDLSDANVEGSTLISPSDADHPDSEHRHTGEPRRARILSIRRTMVANLTVSGVDLSPCVDSLGPVAWTSSASNEARSRAAQQVATADGSISMDATPNDRRGAHLALPAAAPER